MQKTGDVFSSGIKHSRWSPRCVQPRDSTGSKPRRKVEARCKSRWERRWRGSLFMARIQSNESNLALTCRRWLGVRSRAVPCSTLGYGPDIAVFSPNLRLYQRKVSPAQLSLLLFSCPRIRVSRWPAWKLKAIEHQREEMVFCFHNRLAREKERNFPTSFPVASSREGERERERNVRKELMDVKGRKKAERKLTNR